MQSRWDMARISAPEELPSNVIVLEKTNQLLVNSLWPMYLCFFKYYSTKTIMYSHNTLFLIFVRHHRACIRLSATSTLLATTLSFTLTAWPP